MRWFTRLDRRRARLSLERLEDRVVLSAFTVTNLNDSGPGSLRAEIAAANAHSGANAIDFQIDLKVDPKFAVPMANLSLGATTNIAGTAHPQPAVVVPAKKP